MAKKALAIKYRPLTFTDIAGQDTNVEIMRAMVIRDEVPTSIVVSGPSGTGKTTSARILSRALICDHPDTRQHPCNECRACKEHLNDASFSYLERDSSVAGNVEEIKRLREEAFYMMTKYKIIVLDEFHLASRQSQSLLLKFLEEAPEGIVFMFCTTDPDKILHTIHSRSFEITMQPIPTDASVERLLYICSKEGISADPQALYRISLLSKGQMRNALNMLDQLQLIAGARGARIEVGLVEEIFGKSSDEAILNLFAAMKTRQDFKPQFDALIKSVNVYQLPDETFRVLQNMVRLHIGLGVSWSGDILATYQHVANLFGDSVFRLIKTLSTPSFTNFFSLESLYAYLLYVKHAVIGTQKMKNKSIDPEQDVESYRQSFTKQ